MLKINIYSEIDFEFYIRGTVHSTSWIFSLYFVYIFKTDSKFLFKFTDSDSSFNSNILRFLSIKSKTSAHTQTTINHYIYNSFAMTWISNLHWGYILMKKVSKWFYQLDYVIFYKNVFWYLSCTLFFFQIHYIQISIL